MSFILFYAFVKDMKRSDENSPPRPCRGAGRVPLFAGSCDVQALWHLTCIQTPAQFHEGTSTSKRCC